MALEKTRLKIEKILKGAQSARTMDRVAKRAAKLIKDRTRRGRGVDGRKLKRLKESTIKNRRRAKGKLSPKTSPEKSNLTFTGQMLDAIRGRGFIRKITIFFRESRRDKKTNSEIAIFNELKGRLFFGLNKKEINKITKNLSRDIRDELRRKLT